MSIQQNMNTSKTGWEQIKKNVMHQLEGALHMEGVKIEYTNWIEDAIRKIDSIITFIDRNGTNVTKNIQFRFWHEMDPSAAGNYLTIRLKSWSMNLQKMVDSEFYTGKDIDYFIWGVLDKDDKILRYIIIDWKKLFPKFNYSIFPWSSNEYNSRKNNNYFYYEKYLPALDGIHKNSMITIPIEEGKLVNKIDKSLEHLFPEVIILKVGFRK